MMREIIRKNNLGELIDSGMGQRTSKMSLKHLVTPDSKKVLKTNKQTRTVKTHMCMYMYFKGTQN